MSSDVAYNCATCSKTVKGKQHYAICVSCSSRVHRKCYGDGISHSDWTTIRQNGDGISHSDWTTIRQNFTCAECEARIQGQRFNRNYCSDGERLLVIEESTEKTKFENKIRKQNTKTKYEIIIGASQKGGDVVIDGCGYTYGFHIDYPGLRVWRCTFRGCVEFAHCNSILKQIKRPGIDFLRNYSQEDFTSNAEKAHSQRPNDGVHKRQLTVGQSCSTTSGPSYTLFNRSHASSQITLNLAV